MSLFDRGTYVNRQTLPELERTQFYGISKIDGKLCVVKSIFGIYTLDEANRMIARMLEAEREEDNA